MEGACGGRIFSSDCMSADWPHVAIKDTYQERCGLGLEYIARVTEFYS